MSAQKFRRKVTETTAEQFLDPENLPQGVSKREATIPGRPKTTVFYVTTIHGQMTEVVLNDWILPEPDGVHFYPVKPDIFAKTYDSISGETILERLRALQNTGGIPGMIEQGEAERGFYNGIEMTLALLEDREPTFRTQEQNTGTQSFRAALEYLLNYHSMEGRGRGGDTPDFILADFLDGALALFDKTMQAREGWYGRTPQEVKDGVSLAQLRVPLDIKAEEPPQPVAAPLYPPSDHDSGPETKEHIARVRNLLQQVVVNLCQRGAVHDESKLQEPEKSGFDNVKLKLSTAEYGSDEYKAGLADLGPALEHHYRENDHHPEHYAMEFDAGEARDRAMKNGLGIARMSLFALIEMLVDWKAATERMKGGGDIWASLEFNTTRFGLSPQLQSIFATTIHEFGW